MNRSAPTHTASAATTAKWTQANKRTAMLKLTIGAAHDKRATKVHTLPALYSIITCARGLRSTAAQQSSTIPKPMNRQTRYLTKRGLCNHKLRGPCKKEQLGGKKLAEMQADCVKQVVHGRAGQRRAKRVGDMPVRAALNAALYTEQVLLGVPPHRILQPTKA